MLGHGNRGHVQLLHLIEQFVNPAGAVEQREFRVEVEVDELGHGHCWLHSHSIVEGGFELMS